MCRAASSHHWSSHARHVSSAQASATVRCPRMLAAYASNEWPPLSSRASSSVARGVIRSTMVATNRRPGRAWSGPMRGFDGFDR